MFLTPLLGLGDVVGTVEIIRVASQPTSLALGVTGLAAFGLLTETLTLAITPIREEDLVAVLADTFGYDAAHPAKSSKLIRTREENPHRKKTKNTPPRRRKKTIWVEWQARKRPGRKTDFQTGGFRRISLRRCQRDRRGSPGLVFGDSKSPTWGCFVQFSDFIVPDTIQSLC